MHSVLQRELPATAPDFQATARLFGCVPLTCWSISEDRHVSGSRFVPLFTPSLQWVPWPPHLPWPCGSPPSSVLWDRTIPPNPSSAVSGCPRPPTTSSATFTVRRLREVFPSSWRIPVKACLGLETPAAPGNLA